MEGKIVRWAGRSHCEVCSVTTLSGAVINTVGDRRLNNKRALRKNTARGKPKYLEKKLSQFQFIQPKSHKDCRSIERGPPLSDVGD
jgi:hypothetical protein